MGGGWVGAGGGGGVFGLHLTSFMRLLAGLHV